MHRKESLTQLEPHLSRLLDSLCFQLAYTRDDSNSLSLLEILNWRITDQIDQTQFTQLYKQWLISKGVFDITKTKQIDTFNKMQLTKLDTEINLRKQSEIVKIMKVLRRQYNQIFLSLNREKEKIKLMEAVDSLFSMLDIDECYHLRKPQLVILFEALLLSRVFILKPATVDNYWRVFNGFQKQINIVDNKVTIRGFKNYLIKNVTVEQVQLIAKNLDGLKYLMGFYEEGVKTWKKHQKDLSGKQELVCRRIFLDNQHLFLGQSQNHENTLTQLSIRYGAGFLAINNIDAKTIQQFGKIIDGTVRKHITQVLRSIQKQESQTSSLHTQTSKTKTIKINKSISNKKSLIKRQSMRTPTKSQSFFTPRKQTTNTRNKVVVSPLSKTRQTINTFSPTNPNAILQSLSIFKNQRIESFQSVMKRLKKR